MDTFSKAGSTSHPSLTAMNTSLFGSSFELISCRGLVSVEVVEIIFIRLPEALLESSLYHVHQGTLQLNEFVWDICV